MSCYVTVLEVLPMHVHTIVTVSIATLACTLKARQWQVNKTCHSYLLVLLMLMWTEAARMADLKALAVA